MSSRCGPQVRPTSALHFPSEELMEKKRAINESVKGIWLEDRERLA
jgi:hypothetical protein